uniref:V-set domain containing T cell activation inhibitor 1 n=2 Tax=Canis lupus familiaris TaxID=9615 RepID=A0A8C0SIF1_CANLF
MASPGQIIFWSIISVIIILAGAIALIIGFGISEVSVRNLVMRGLCRHSKISLGIDPCFLNYRETLHYSHHSHLRWKHWGGWNPELHF